MNTRLIPAIAFAILAIGGVTACEDTQNTNNGAVTQESTPNADKFRADWETNFGTTTWGQYATEFAERQGDMIITAQINRSDPESKDIAEKIARAGVNTLNAGDYGTYRWVIVEDGTGTVITQQRVQ